MFWFIFLKKMVQIRRCTPRQVPAGARGHVILCAYDAVASGVIERLERQRIAYYVIESDRTVFADKGLKKVEAYLLLLTASLQVLMIFNSIYQHPLQATKPFRFALDECPPLT